MLAECFNHATTITASAPAAASATAALAAASCNEFMQKYFCNISHNNQSKIKWHSKRRTTHAHRAETKGRWCSVLVSERGVQRGGKLGGRCKGRTAACPAGHWSKGTRLQLCTQCRVLTYAYVSERGLLEEYEVQQKEYQVVVQECKGKYKINKMYTVNVRSALWINIT